MKIEVNSEKLNLRLSITIQTKESISHKLLTEDDNLCKILTKLFQDTGLVAVEILNHELTIKYPEGIK